MVGSVGRILFGLCSVLARRLGVLCRIAFGGTGMMVGMLCIFCCLGRCACSGCICIPSLGLVGCRLVGVLGFLVLVCVCGSVGTCLCFVFECLY